uniref:hypothetical protein n=1 Tax=Mycobacterium avium TaxID=1764 RepID=UPI0018C8600E
VVFWDFDGTLAHRPGMWAGALCDAVRSIDSSCVVTIDEVRPHLQQGFPWHHAEHIRAPGTSDGWWRQLTPVLIDALTANGVPPHIADGAVERMPSEFYRPNAWRVEEQA